MALSPTVLAANSSDPNLNSTSANNSHNGSRVADIIVSVTSNNGINNSANNSDCSIFREVASLLLFGKRAELTNTGCHVVLSMLTGELLAASDSATTTSDPISNLMIDTPTHAARSSGSATPNPLPTALTVLTPSMISEVEHLLWAIVLAPSPLFCTCPAPPRAVAAYCLRYYRKILSAAKWKVKSLNYYASKDTSNNGRSGTESGGRSIFTFSSSQSTMNTSHQLVEPDVEEIFAVIHLLSVICRAVLLGYIGISKQHARSPAESFVDSRSERFTFSQLLEALTPGTKSDIANLMLEAIAHCNRLFRRRYSRLWLSPGNERVSDASLLQLTRYMNEDFISNNQSSPWIRNRNSGTAHPVIYEFMDRYIRQPVPIFPTMALFEEISSSLPMPVSVTQTLTSIFSNV
jgi:hypothetical protein